MSRNEKKVVFLCIILALSAFVSGIYIADRNTKQVSGYLNGQTMFEVEFGQNPSVTVFNKKFTFRDKAL